MNRIATEIKAINGLRQITTAIASVQTLISNPAPLNRPNRVAVCRKPLSDGENCAPAALPNSSVAPVPKTNSARSQHAIKQNVAQIRPLYRIAALFAHFTFSARAAAKYGRAICNEIKSYLQL